MNTNNKAAYWIALGVLALGLNSEYQRGRLPELHRLAERTNAVLCRISARAQQTLALARLMTDRSQFATDDLLASADENEMVQDEKELLSDRVRDRAELFREQVQDEIRSRADIVLTSAEIERIQLRSDSEFRLANRRVDGRVTIICPKTGARISVKAPVADNSANAEVVDTH
jgi:hypothetical protein